jgi:glycosyltransferase involved in cell wall biosynthesis
MDTITIITVCFNSAGTIRETIDSVLSQDYPALEYVIVDGLSTDGTQDIVRSYGSRVRFLSEKDNGLYDAMNKGIRMATGEIVGILNSDDIYATQQVLSDVMRAFEIPTVDSVFGDLYYFKTGAPSKPLRYFLGKSFNPAMPSIGILPPHPTFFVRRKIYERHGDFDTQFKYAADFDLMLRFLCVHKITFVYIPKILTKMRIGGLSTMGFRRTIEINKEDLRAYKKHGLKTNWFAFHVKYLVKILYIRRLGWLFD